MPTVDLTSPGGAFTPAAVGDGVTDDAPAIRAFNDWARAQTSPITLTLGSGSKTFLFNSADTNGLRGNSPAWGVAQPLTVTGNGETTTILKAGSAGFFLGAQSNIKSGNGNYPSGSAYVALLDTVRAGASQLFCKTTANAALFANSTWALISSVDPQGGGQPPNPMNFEFVFITSVDTVAGTIDLQSPLQRTYLDTLPNVFPGNPGFEPYAGGPATLYVLDQSWVIDVLYENLGIDQNPGPTYADGFRVAFANVKSINGNGVVPSMSGTFTQTNCDLGGVEIEVDKIIGSLVNDGCTGELLFQSAIPSVTLRNGCVIGQLNGTPGNLTIADSTITDVGVGSTSFGATNSITATNSAFSGDFDYKPVVDTGDVTGTFQADYSMSGGVITVPRAGLPYGVRWGIPGAWCHWRDTDLGKFGPVFQVLDVTGDGTNFYVATSWPGGFPTYATGITMVACLRANFQGCSGNARVLNLVAAAAAGYANSYVQRYNADTFNGGNMGVNASGQTASLTDSPVGRLLSLVVDVQTPYTGAQSSLTWHATQFDNFQVRNGDGTLGSWNPVFDLRTAGKRTITRAGATSPGGAADSGLALSDADCWIQGFAANACASHDITSEYAANPTVGPVFSLTMITDQGIAFPASTTSPLRLRLH